MGKLLTIIIVIIALVFTYLLSSVLPNAQFEHYKLQIDSTFKYNKEELKVYFADLNYDNKPEKIEHYLINTPRHGIDIQRGDKLICSFAFEKNETFVSLKLNFADLNKNNAAEMLYVTVINGIVYLNIVEINLNTQSFTWLGKVKVDTCARYNNEYDLINFDLLVDKQDVFFNLQAGYSIQPRNTYRFNYKDKTLIKTKRNSIVNRKLKLVKQKNKRFILECDISASDNTISTTDSILLSKSTHPDSLNIYYAKKDKTYQYGDFSSYILLYNDQLDFAFEPIEFPGWANYTHSELIWQDTSLCIAAITNNLLEGSMNKKITICNLNGEIIQQIPMPFDYTHIYADHNQLILRYGNELHIYFENLELIEKLEPTQGSKGFIDLDNEGQKEFIAYQDNKLIIFTNDFSHRTTFEIQHELTPFQLASKIKTFDKDGNRYFYFSSGMYYYIFSYSKNKLAFLKYPFYLLLFVFWYALIWSVVKLNSKRLEAEKRNLEQIVSDRTLELQSKNSELASQKEEIQSQAEELSTQNEHLEKLSEFKKSLTSTLVHDLKNPLSQILTNSSDYTVKTPAQKMLRLVMNLLDVEKYENARFKLNKQTHSLRDLVNEALAGQTLSLREKNLEAVFHFNDFVVTADKEVMLRVFDNLLSNAIRFSPQNQSIEFYAEKHLDNAVKIGVKNHGAYIPTDALHKVFDKFTQFGSNSSGHQSTGLGLTFCKMALKAHGQSIAAKNLDDGVLFEFSLQGEISKADEQVHETPSRSINLLPEEKELLASWFKQLKNLDIYQISDIHKILEQIPDQSVNIIALKKQLSEAAFNNNAELYARIVG